MAELVQPVVRFRTFDQDWRIVIAGDNDIGSFDAC
jgi:hypothetical protein